MFFPPVSFGLVEEGLYRSALPNEINYPFLERLGLKTIIYLYPDDDIDAQLVSFLEDQDVTLVSLGEHDDKRNKSWAPVGEEIVLAALERIVDSVHYPVLITCNTGKHRTGTVVACLRKLQRWNLTSIFEEYRRFTKHKFGVAESMCDFYFSRSWCKIFALSGIRRVVKVRVQNEQFIELFDTDLVNLPPEAPRFVNR